MGTSLGSPPIDSMTRRVCKDPSWDLVDLGLLAVILYSLKWHFVSTCYLRLVSLSTSGRIDSGKLGETSFIAAYYCGDVRESLGTV